MRTGSLGCWVQNKLVSNEDYLNLFLCSVSIKISFRLELNLFLWDVCCSRNVSVGHKFFGFANVDDRNTRSLPVTFKLLKSKLFSVLMGGFSLKSLVDLNRLKIDKTVLQAVNKVLTWKWRVGNSYWQRLYSI